MFDNQARKSATIIVLIQKVITLLNTQLTVIFGSLWGPKRITTYSSQWIWAQKTTFIVILRNVFHKYFNKTDAEITYQSREKNHILKVVPFIFMNETINMG